MFNILTVITLVVGNMILGSLMWINYENRPRSYEQYPEIPTVNDYDGCKIRIYPSNGGDFHDSTNDILSKNIGTITVTKDYMVITYAALDDGSIQRVVVDHTNQVMFIQCDVVGAQVLLK